MVKNFITKVIRKIKKFGIIRLIIIFILLGIAVYTQLPEQQVTTEVSAEPISNDDNTESISKSAFIQQRFIYNKNTTVTAVNIKFNMLDGHVNTQELYLKFLTKDQYRKIKNGLTTLADPEFEKDKTVLKVSDINPDGYTHIKLKTPIFCMKKRSAYMFIEGPELKPGEYSPGVDLGTAAKPNRVLFYNNSRQIRQGIMMTYESEYDNSFNMIIVYSMIMFLAIIVVPPRWFYKDIGDAFGWGYFVANPAIICYLNFKFIEVMFKHEYVYFYTWLVLLAIQMILYAVIGNKNASMIITTIVAFVVNVVNSQVAVFKGEPLAPQDILFVKTAADVSSNYQITWTATQQRNLAVLAVYVVFMFIVCTQNHKERDAYRLKKKEAKIAKKALANADADLEADNDDKNTKASKKEEKTEVVIEAAEVKETDDVKATEVVSDVDTEEDNRGFFTRLTDWLQDNIEDKSEVVHTYRKYKTMSYKKRRIIERGSACVAGVAILAILYVTPLLTNAGISVFPFNRNKSCNRNGIVLEFFMDFHYIGIDKPSGYSLNKLAKLVEDKTTEPVSSETNPMTGGKDPNILVVMNESFVDFTTINGGKYVWFAEDYLPNIHALKDNVIKGKSYCSTFGGQTANAEFEQMTANSLAFFPAGSVAFQQFIKEGKTTFGLPLYLQSKGYQTMAIHPAIATNWNRNVAYPSLNFHKFLTLKDFNNPEIVRYVSDRETYKKVIEQFENKDKDEKLYTHCVTIQNHGGYTIPTDWEHPLLAMKGGYSKANEFISSMYVCDQAYKELIDYFKNYDEPTIILMFGDHQPALGGFSNRAIGMKSLPQDTDPSLTMMQEKYCTDYYLWANYDLKETDLDRTTSLNFLSNLLVEKAGIPLSRYQQIVAEVNEKVEAMNAFGYKLRSDGKWHEYTEKTEASDVLKDYNTAEYGYFYEKDQEKIGEIFELPLRDESADTGE